MIETDIYPVEFGPHKGKVRWALSYKGMPLESGHARDEITAREDAGKRRTELERDLERQNR